MQIKFYGAPGISCIRGLDDLLSNSIFFIWSDIFAIHPLEAIRHKDNETDIYCYINDNQFLAS